MKKILFILALISIIAFPSIAQDKTGAIRTGFTQLSKPLVFTAADSVAGKGGFHISSTGSADSIVILITNIQKYMQNQVFTTTLSARSGSPNVTITLRGRVTSTDSWHPIGTAVTWTSSSNNPGTISSTSPVNYNWLKVSYVSTGATQCSKILTAEIRTSNAYEIPANSGTLTVSRATTGTVTITTKDNNADAATVYRAGGTGALTLGSTSGATAITSNGTITMAGNLASTGTIDNVVVNSAAGGDKSFNAGITQVAGTELTGNLIGLGVAATNGTTSGVTSGVIYGIEAKSRAADPSNTGAAISRLDGVYASVDVKNKTATTIRAFEASLDGGAGGASTEAVAFEAFNNSSATQTASYAFSANGGTADGHKTYTHDIRLQNGEFVDNTTDGSITVPNVIRKHTPVAVNATATVSAATMLAGVVTSTSAQATSITTPTATAIAALIPGCGAGTAFDLIIDNSAGQSTVTLVLDGSITVVNPAIITGGATLTLATLTTGKFSFYFTSGTAAKCYRVY